MKVNNFNDIAKDSLDEWVYFLKNSEIKDEFKAKGLDKAKEKFNYDTIADLTELNPEQIEQLRKEMD